MPNDLPKGALDRVRGAYTGDSTDKPFNKRSHNNTPLTSVLRTGCALPVGFSSDIMLGGVRELIGYWERGELKLSSQQVFEFDDALSAIAHIAGGKVEGRVIVRVKKP